MTWYLTSDDIIGIACIGLLILWGLFSCLVMAVALLIEKIKAWWLAAALAFAAVGEQLTAVWRSRL